MEFAKRELEKYGWTEGQGLGKNENGIVKALKPKLKFDGAGLGHDVYEEYKNQWWHKLYDEACSNIVTEEGNDGVIVKTKNSVKHKRKKRQTENGYYKDFIKTSNLDGHKEKKFCKSECDSEVENSGDESVNKGKTELLEAELFKVCGGRTGHKGARHGLKMSAKLARIEEQEKNLLKSAINVNKNGSEVSEKKKKKGN